MEKIFPTVLMALDFLAAVPYAVKGGHEDACVLDCGRRAHFFRNVDVKMIMNLGLPYKGSKNTIANDIVKALPRGKKLLDACCGGGAILMAADRAAARRTIVQELDKNAKAILKRLNKNT